MFDAAHRRCWHVDGRTLLPAIAEPFPDPGARCRAPASSSTADRGRRCRPGRGARRAGRRGARARGVPGRRRPALGRRPARGRGGRARSRDVPDAARRPADGRGARRRGPAPSTSTAASAPRRTRSTGSPPAALLRAASSPSRCCSAPQSVRPAEPPVPRANVKDRGAVRRRRDDRAPTATTEARRVLDRHRPRLVPFAVDAVALHAPRTVLDRRAGARRHRHPGIGSPALVSRPHRASSRSTPPPE